MRASHFVYIVVAFTTFAATDLLFNRDNALADFNEAIQLNPKMVKAYVGRGTFFVMKDFDRALAEFNQAIRLDPKEPSAY